MTPRRGATRFVVSDHETPGVGQATRTEFLDALRGSVVQAADNALRNVGQTSDQCPYVSYWFDYYGRKSPAHIEKSIQRYAPGAVLVNDWRECVGVVTRRVDEAFGRFVRTGSMAGVPSDLPDLEGRGRRAGRGAALQRKRNVAQACGDCFGSGGATYVPLTVVDNLPAWGPNTVHLGYHGTTAWDAIQSSGVFTPGGGRLGPGIYVGATMFWAKTYAQLGTALGGAQSTILEVGYAGATGGWVVHHLNSLGDYSDALEGQYDVLEQGSGNSLQRCYKTDGPSHIDPANFRVRVAAQ